MYKADRSYTYIYAMCDPDTQQVKYIGQATSPKDRCDGHVWESRHPSHKSLKCVWIRQLASEGKRPMLKILLKVSMACAIEYEKIMIIHYKKSGANLVNTMYGGENGKMLIPPDSKLWRKGKRSPRRGSPDFFSDEDATKMLQKISKVRR